MAQPKARVKCRWMTDCYLWLIAALTALWDIVVAEALCQVASWPNTKKTGQSNVVRRFLIFIPALSHESWVMVVAEALCQVSSWPKQKGQSIQVLVIVGHLGQIKTDKCCRSESWNDDTWGILLDNRGLKLIQCICLPLLSCNFGLDLQHVESKIAAKVPGGIVAQHKKKSRPVECCPAIFDFHSSIKSWVMSHGGGWSLVPGVIMAQTKRPFERIVGHRRTLRTNQNRHMLPFWVMKWWHLNLRACFRESWLEPFIASVCHCCLAIQRIESKIAAKVPGGIVAQHKKFQASQMLSGDFWFSFQH